MNFASLILLGSILTACNGSSNGVVDEPDQGTIHISVDESFRPVIDEQIDIYQKQYPKAHIIVDYKAESECIRDCQNDSTNRLVVVSRPLNSTEEKRVKEFHGYSPETNIVAYDAVAIIVNKNATDSLFDLATLRELLTGRKATEKIFVMDGLKATSTVRLVREKILGGELLDTNVVKSARSTPDVIKYVRNHDNAIGFVGYSWVGNRNDKEQQDSLTDIRICYLKCNTCEQQPYVKPTQESLIYRRYPLMQNIYYILKENYSGLGAGFTSFMKYESGQLVFWKACLAPVMDFTIRKVKLSSKISQN